MTADERPAQYPTSGIYVGQVGRDISFSALGHIVGGDLTINTTIQVSVDAVTQRPLNTALPYRGLERFEDRGENLFFGRDQWIRNQIALLSKNNLLLVLGASGSGKSSVVRAGLLPRLSELLGQQFRSFTFVPDVDPYNSLRCSLQAGGISKEKLRPLLTGDSVGVAIALSALRPGGEQWLIFVDQLEEIFTACDEAVRRSFVATLAEIANDTSGSLKLVLAMRADFFDRFSPHPDFVRIFEKSIAYVADMLPDELRLAIEQPAARRGVVFEAGLVEQIIKDVQGQAGSLPLLQYTLKLLWEAEAGNLENRHLRTSTYRELGGVRGALQQRADEIYAGFTRAAGPKGEMEVNEILRRIFLRLVDIVGVESGNVAWRPIRRRTAFATFTGHRELELLGALIEAKLLVSDQEKNTAIVEVAHEALFTSWERLNRWIESGRQVIYVRHRLTDDALRWQRGAAASNGVADEELLSGLRLTQAIEMRIRGDFTAVGGGLGELENRFLDRSAVQQERRRLERRRRQRIARIAMAGMAAVALALGFLVHKTVTQRGQNQQLLIQSWARLQASSSSLSRPVFESLWDMAALPDADDRLRVDFWSTGVQDRYAFESLLYQFPLVVRASAGLVETRGSPIAHAIWDTQVAQGSGTLVRQGLICDWAAVAPPKEFERLCSSLPAIPGEVRERICLEFERHTPQMPPERKARFASNLLRAVCPILLHPRPDTVGSSIPGFKIPVAGIVQSADEESIRTFVAYGLGPNRSSEERIEWFNSISLLTDVPYGEVKPDHGGKATLVEALVADFGQLSTSEQVGVARPLAHLAAWNIKTLSPLVVDMLLNKLAGAGTNDQENLVIGLADVVNGLAPEKADEVGREVLKVLPAILDYSTIHLFSAPQIALASSPTTAADIAKVLAARSHGAAFYQEMERHRTGAGLERKTVSSILDAILSTLKSTPQQESAFPLVNLGCHASIESADALALHLLTEFRATAADDRDRMVEGLCTMMPLVTEVRAAQILSELQRGGFVFRLGLWWPANLPAPGTMKTIAEQLLTSERPGKAGSWERVLPLLACCFSAGDDSAANAITGGILRELETMPSGADLPVEVLVILKAAALRVEPELATEVVGRLATGIGRRPVPKSGSNDDPFLKRLGETSWDLARAKPAALSAVADGWILAFETTPSVHWPDLVAAMIPLLEKGNASVRGRIGAAWLSAYQRCATESLFSFHQSLMFGIDLLDPADAAEIARAVLEKPPGVYGGDKAGQIVFWSGNDDSVRKNPAVRTAIAAVILESMRSKPDQIGALGLNSILAGMSDNLAPDEANRVADFILAANDRTFESLYADSFALIDHISAPKAGVLVRRLTEHWSEKTGAESDASVVRTVNAKKLVEIAKKSDTPKAVAIVTALIDSLKPNPSIIDGELIYSFASLAGTSAMDNALAGQLIALARHQATEDTDYSGLNGDGEVFARIAPELPERLCRRWVAMMAIEQGNMPTSFEEIYRVAPSIRSPQVRWEVLAYCLGEFAARTNWTEVVGRGELPIVNDDRGERPEMHALVVRAVKSLSANQIVELLKFPTSIKWIERILLECLESLAKGQKFHGDLWKAVAWAKLSGIDVSSPPQNPSTPPWLKEEMEKLKVAKKI